jgi:hypothetical protein
MKKPKYKLREIQTIEFITKSPIGEIAYDLLIYQIAHNFRYIEEQKTIKLIVGFKLFQNNEEQEKDNYLIKIAIVNAFEIQNYTDVVEKEENGKTESINIDFARTLLSIAIGTLRGCLHAKTEGIYLNRFFIPIVDATKLIPDKLPSKKSTKKKL